MVVTAVTQGATAASAVPTSNPASEMTSAMNFHASYSDPAHRGAIGRAQERSESVDVIVQLKRNLAQLEDLHGRMSFLMGEIGYLLKATDSL